MSGASKLSKNKEKCYSTKSNYDMDDLDLLSNRNNRNLDRLDFIDEGDEWNAIVKYNRKIHDDEKIENKQKDLEIKRRTKEDLDNQIRQKIKRINEEHLKNNEYDSILLNHCGFLEEIEKKKHQEVKDRIMKEKDNRDKQLLDEKYRKKVEVLKEKKYEKEYVKSIVSELEKDKQIQLHKRMEERETMLKTMKENELNKIRQLDYKEKERLSDIRSTEEFVRVLDRQDQERNEYFKKIERNANNFVNKNATTVLNDLEINKKDDDDKMKNYLAEKEKR